MGRSIKDFKQEFLNILLEIHRRQWAALGAVSGEVEEKQWIIDLESLVMSTFSLGLQDPDLLTAAVQWMDINGDWINLSRYKRLRRVFLETEKEAGGPILNAFLFKHMPSSLARYAHQENVPERQSADQSAADEIEYSQFFRKLEFPGQCREMNVQHPSLLQLLLRGVFGIDARAEVLIYLLSHDSGNSNSIARELFFDQKAVYRIIERWKTVGVVETIPGGRIGNVSVKREEAWMWLLGPSGRADYLNWVRFYLLSATILRGLSVERVAEDEDQTASLFKRLYEDTRVVARPLNVEVPDPRFLPSEEYNQTYMSTWIRILGMVRGV